MKYGPLGLTADDNDGRRTFNNQFGIWDFTAGGTLREIGEG